MFRKIKECGKLFNFYSFCIWGGNMNNIRLVDERLEEIKKDNRFIYIMGYIFRLFCGM